MKELNNIKENIESTKILRKKKGLVVSDSSDKTIVVEVADYKTHPKYVKKYRRDRKYKVHDPNNEYRIGDYVEFIECRSISRCKKWIVLEDKLKQA